MFYGQSHDEQGQLLEDALDGKVVYGYPSASSHNNQFSEVHL